MNRNSILIALVVAATAAPASAEPQPVRGDQFITMMEGNTLSGTTAAGDAFNVYFLAGGTATYQDATGTRDAGSWHIDKEAMSASPGRIRRSGKRAASASPSTDRRWPGKARPAAGEPPCAAASARCS
jgi:hypothetical protein